MKTFNQSSPYESPWTLWTRSLMLVWEYSWILLCSWTPKPLNRWRIFILRIFGATIYGNPFVHQRARIQIPWNLILHDHACLGDGAVAYSLGEIEIFEHATVAQEVYLCTGTHDFENLNRPLQTAKITIGSYAFIGARAFIMPGINIHSGALIGACSVVTRDVPARCTAVGNPARVLINKDTT